MKSRRKLEGSVKAVVELELEIGYVVETKKTDFRVILVGFGVVGSRTEDDHGNSEEEEEHAEFSHAGLDR